MISPHNGGVTHPRHCVLEFYCIKSIGMALCMYYVGEFVMPWAHNDIGLTSPLPQSMCFSSLKLWTVVGIVSFSRPSQWRPWQWNPFMVHLPVHTASDFCFIRHFVISLCAAALCVWFLFVLRNSSLGGHDDDCFLCPGPPQHSEKPYMDCIVTVMLYTTVMTLDSAWHRSFMKM